MPLFVILCCDDRRETLKPAIHWDLSDYKENETTRYCGGDYFCGVISAVASRAKLLRLMPSP